LDASKTVINFGKMRMIANIFLEIQKYQQVLHHRLLVGRDERRKQARKKP
jgi:hypothetical protein